MRAPHLIVSIVCAALAGGVAHGAPVRILVEDAASPWSNHAGEGYANDLVRAAFAAAASTPNWWWCLMRAARRW